MAAERLLGLKVLQDSERMVLYAPIKNEVETDVLFQRLLGSGKRVGFPRITAGGIEFREVREWSSLMPGRWGIREPKEGRVIPLEEIGLVVVPGIAFDESGARIGFGGGFYDRALASFRGCKIGLAYDFQVFREIPQEDGDLRCDWVVTDLRVLSRRNLWNHKPF